MSVAISKPHLSPEEYLTIENAAAFKSEYHDGEMYAMSGGSYEHTIISTNLSIALGTRLRGGRGRTLNPELRVHVPDSPSYYYPDASVVCGTPLFVDTGRTTVSNPTLVVEILSPSSERDDRTKKFWDYQKLSSMKEYVLVTQDAPQVECFIRPSGEASDQWLYNAYKGLDTVLRLTSLGIEFPLNEIYEGVEFQNTTRSIGS